MSEPNRHKVFISYYHEDQEYANRFIQMMGDDIIDRSVGDGDIDDRNRTVEAVRQEIRERHIADATVTVVLIGPCTWQRKHIDWEIAASLRDTPTNPRCGLLGIILPHHPDYGKGQSRRNIRLTPPRLAANIGGDDPFATIYDYPKRNRTRRIRRWIDEAFRRRRGHNPDNSLHPFANNWRGDCSRGWQN